MTKLKRERPTIGVLVGWNVYPGYIDSFLEPVFQGILTAAQNKDCNILMGCGIGTNYPLSQQRPVLPIISPNFEFIPVGPWNCDGLILVTPVANPWVMEYFENLTAQGYPLVYAGECEKGPAVVVDNQYGIKQAMAHLAGHGHRRILFLSGHASSRFSDIQLRRDAYIASVTELGLDPDPELIIYGDHAKEGGQQAMEQVLERGVPFTAVLASNDESALGAMTALHAAGKLIPEDVSIIGFDDRFEAKAHTPTLTTVHHPMYELGCQSVELALKVILAGVSDDDVIRIRPELIIRESCGCPPGTFNEAIKNRQGPETPGGLSIEPAAFGKMAPVVHRSQAVFEEIAALISHTISNELQNMRASEASYLSRRLVNELEKTLKGGDPANFQLAIQQIIKYVASCGDDVYSWQNAVTIIRNYLPDFVNDPEIRLPRNQIEDILHLARVTISEISRGQFSRLMVSESHHASQLGQMTALFFNAKNESEIFDAANRILPSIGIAHIAVAYFESKGDDPVAWSQLKYRSSSDQISSRFETRQFPPPGLYNPDRPFHLALLPLVIQDGNLGYVAFDTNNLDYCGFVVRQMVASLSSVRLHNEAIEAQRVTEEQRKIAEEANRLKGNFLSMVSHELRTPINLISGLTDILLNKGKNSREDSKEVRREDLERLFVAAHHLDGLIRDVLDLASIDVGQLRLTREPLALEEILSTVAMIGQQLAQDKELAWVVEIPDPLPKVWGDRTRLRQVLLNLVANAVKFTSQGQVALKVAAEECQVTISVSDTGLGILPEEHKVIFDEFRQSERTTARGYGGLGLGLAICKHLVELHGGTIGVFSSGEEGAGSRFYFTLPVLANQENLSFQNTPLAQTQRVALLASDPGRMVFLSDLLCRHGIGVEFVRVGERDENWMACLLAANPDLVVMEMGLASARGWEILKVLNENQDLQRISVMFYKQPDEQGQGSLFEIKHLTKPLGEMELAETLISQGVITPEINAEQKKKILIVDDEPDTVELHSRIVKSQFPESQIIRAYNGRAALECIRGNHPDLVLLDLMMPEISGFQVLRAIREDGGSRNIPVIVLTSQSLTQKDMERLNSGVASVLGKGMFSSDEIVVRLKDALGRRHRPGSESHGIVLKAMAFVHVHYAEAISRQDVAAHVGLSERHLTRCFRQEIGITPIMYLNRFRVRQAKRLLETGEKSITRVALDVGFSSGAYFTRVFQEEVGRSPRDFLKKSI